MDNTPLPPFDWGQTPQSIGAAAEAVMAAAKANLDRVASIPDADLTFENCIAPLMAPPNFKTNPLVCQTKFLQHCSTDEKVREAACEAGTTFSKFRVSSRMRGDVFGKVKAFASTKPALSEYQQHFLDAIVSDFERGGLGLGESERVQLEDLFSKDSDCCSRYSANIVADTTELFFTEDELAGMPADFVSERRGADGRVKVTLKYPDTVPIMGHCSVPATRKAVAEAKGKAYGDNLELMKEGIGYRKQIAGLLGHDSWNDYITERRMTGSSKVVEEFLSTLHENLHAPAMKDLARLRELKAKTEGVDATECSIHAYDLSYYHNLLLKQEHGVDDNVIKEYFPLPVIVDQTLAIYQELLSLEFVEREPGFSRWHDEVRLFTVFDKSEGKRGELMGHFYLDLHPRQGKYNHAAIFHLLKRNGAQAPVDCMLCNLPVKGADGSPALLRHDDVVTFFHEFGHIMHGLCCEGDGNSTRLAKCPRDFVEAPSQMLENWCWQAEVLARLSSHHKTGESLPDNLLQQLIAAKNVNVAIFTCRQIYLATMDITLHGRTPPANIQAMSDSLAAELALVPNIPGTSMLRSFGHLMNQYSSSYYGYLWSEVLSADMFHTRFAKEGIFNPKTGMEYRKFVLAPGGVGSIMEHLKKFLGREPQQDSFLRSRGLL